MTFLRPLAFLLMIALLVAGQWGVAQNRLHAQPVGYIELCHGFETSVIAIDAQGREVPEHTHCPDCVPSLLLLPHTGLNAAAIEHQLRATTAPALQHQVPLPQARQRPYTARAPPRLV